MSRVLKIIYSVGLSMLWIGLVTHNIYIRDTSKLEGDVSVVVSMSAS